MEEQKQEKGVRTPVAADDNMLGSTERKLKDQIEKLSTCATHISQRTAGTTVVEI